MPDGMRRAMRAFLETFRDDSVEVPKSLQSEPPDVIYTGLLEQEEIKLPELTELMAGSRDLPENEPDIPALDPADDPFSDISLEDALTI